MSNPRSYEMYDADAEYSMTESKIADYSVIERNMEESRGEPTLPSGDVIDCKNTLQSYDYPLDGSTATATTSRISNRNATKALIGTTAESKRQSEISSNTNSAAVTNTSNNSNFEAVQAVAIVEGKLYTENPENPRRDRTIWWVIGCVVLVCAVVITGVCASGKCGAKSDDAPSAPIPNSTLPPTMSPTETPIEVLVERAVTSYVKNCTLSEEEIVVNGTNSESRALTWLIYEDEVFSNSELLALNTEIETNISFRLRQRFPLLVIWFQQLVDEESVSYKKWAKTLGWLENDNECEWFGIYCTSFNLGGTIGLQNVVTEIDFFNDETGASNKYFGSIPPDIGLLTSLTLLDLYSQVVTGSLPEALSHCSHLEYLDLNGCLLVGTLPHSIGKLTALSHLDLSYNAFFGTLPTSSEFFLNLTFFSVYSNALSGSLPNFISGWTALTRLDFSENELTGTIPESIGLLTNLTFLDLHWNDLQGSLPSSIGNLINLTSFDVAFNHFAGTIPISVGNWSQIQSAFFDHNQFSGSVPAEICNHYDPTEDIIFVDCNFNCTCCKHRDNC